MGGFLVRTIAKASRAIYQLLNEAIEAISANRKACPRHKESDSQRLTIVQFGDYGEAYFRFLGGGAENYYAQKYSVDFVDSLARRPAMESLTVVCLAADAPEVVLPNGVRTLGVDLSQQGRVSQYKHLVDAVRRTQPTHLIVMSPCIPLISWGIRSGIHVLPMFADSFRSSGLIAKFRHRLLAKLLNAKAIHVVANHNLAASLDLRRIGVDVRKIIPFDWPALISPKGYDAKDAPSTHRSFNLLYVGSLIESKGVGDVIEAVSTLERRGIKITLSIIGRGETELFLRLAKDKLIADKVFFLGPKSHADVIAAMRDHDAVVVPSRWSYPEGLPMTLYEAFCSRTPLLTSDHPMFSLKIRDNENALVFRQKDFDALADCIQRLATSPELYVRLSEASGEAAADFLCPLKYDNLIADFLDPKRRSTLLNYSLHNYGNFKS